MKNLTFLIIFLAGLFAGLSISSTTNKPTALTPIVPVDTTSVDYFEVIRGSEDGKTICYSVTVTDTAGFKTGYDFLTLRQLDSVMAGYELK